MKNGAKTEEFTALPVSARFFIFPRPLFICSEEEPKKFHISSARPQEPILPAFVLKASEYQKRLLEKNALKLNFVNNLAATRDKVIFKVDTMISTFHSL